MSTSEDRPPSEPLRFADDELRLAREEERSPAKEIQHIHERSSSRQFIDDDRLRFTLTDCMQVTFGIAFGLAGGTWIHPGWFTLIVGMFVLGGLAIHHINPPETHCMQVARVTLLAGYLASVVAAFAKM